MAEKVSRSFRYFGIYNKMKIKLREEQKLEYKKMSVEEIMEEIRKRNPNVMECDIINAAIWIKKETK